MTVLGRRGHELYKEIENTDHILLCSNARNAHPIFFHHLLKGLRSGARMYAVDPRRSESAQWADVWLGIDVGSDIALANAMAKVIIDEGLHDREFIERATTGFDAYAEKVSEYDLARAEQITGVPADAIREVAIAYATAPTAQLCWTLGITEHHTAATTSRPDQPGPARPRRPLRLRAAPIAGRTTCKAAATWCPPLPVARLPTSRTPGRGIRGGVECVDPPAGMASHPDVRGDGGAKLAACT